MRISVGFAAMVYVIFMVGMWMLVGHAAEVNSEMDKQFQQKTIVIGEKEIRYAVHVPAEYDPKTPTPTIVFLHGIGECGTDGVAPLRVGIAEAIKKNPQEWPFIVIFPQKEKSSDSWGNKDAMVIAILKKTQDEFNVDKTRIYLTGISQGGHGTWAIGANHPQLFAAIAPVCGWGSESMAKKLTKMPIWVFHGDKDPLVTVEAARNMEKWLKSAGGTMKLTVYPDVGHNSWDKAYRKEQLAAWFLKHKR